MSKALVFIILSVIMLASCTASKDGIAQKQSGQIRPAVAIVRKWMPTDLFNLLFPIRLKLSSPISGQVNNSNASAGTFEVEITEVVYLGPGGDPSKSQLVAIAYPTDKPFSAEHLLGKIDANMPLQNIAETILAKTRTQPDSPLWVAALNLEASWTPWKLSIVSRSGAIASTTSLSFPQNQAISIFNGAAIPVVDIDTSQVTVPLDGGTPLQVSAAIKFQPNEVAFAFFPAATFPVSSQINWDTSSIDLSLIAPDSSTNIQIPESLVNSVLANNFPNKEFMIAQIPLRNPNVSFATNAFELNGVLDPAAFVNPQADPTYKPEDVRPAVSFRFKGSDLIFDEMSKRPIECGPSVPSVVCNTVGVKVGLSCLATTTGFSGQLLRPKNSFHVGLLNLADKRVNFEGKLLNWSSTPAGFQISGHLSLEVR